MMQDITVYLIGLLTLVCLGYQLYRFFTCKKTANHPCSACTAACALRTTNRTKALTAWAPTIGRTSGDKA
jgi:hypothetical protein